MKNNITYMLLSALVLVALPACGGSKKNSKAKTETINNAIDSLVITEIGQVNEATQQEAPADAAADNISKF
jgi:hypothetical protein